MINRRFLIGSGYFEPPNAVWQKWFWPLWMRNTMPLRTLVLSTGGMPPRYEGGDLVTAPLQVTHLEGNLGSFMELINHQKPHRFCGWMGAVMYLASAAYNDESDLIYKEADCLTFGPCIEKMYEEIGDAGIIFGSTNGQPCAQSLFLVKHEFIPEFLSLLWASGPQSEKWQLGEEIFATLESKNPTMWKRFSFGYDRTRPLDIKNECFYAQKFTPQELLDLRAAGMVKFDSLPEGVEVFSSTPNR